MGTRLGEVLADMGAVTPQGIAVAVIESSARRTPMGDTLIDQGYTSRETVLRALELQRRLRDRHARTRALAQAEIALEAAQSTSRRAVEVREHAQALKRATTGRGHPAVKP